MRHLVLIAISVLAIIGCSLNTTAESVTREKIKRVTSIYESCLKESASTELETCLLGYAKKERVEMSSLLLDGFGGYLLLNKSSACSSSQVCLPYSPGENRTDDCGLQDDLDLKLCQ